MSKAGSKAVHILQSREGTDVGMRRHDQDNASLFLALEMGSQIQQFGF